VRRTNRLGHVSSYHGIAQLRPLRRCLECTAERAPVTDWHRPIAHPQACVRPEHGLLLAGASCMQSIQLDDERPPAWLGWTVVVTTVLVLGATFYVLLASRTTCGGPSKQAHAQLFVEQYAYDTYPRFIVSHPVDCPVAVHELDASLGHPIDPWGSRYRFVCSPGGVLSVHSAGEDRRWKTADDISSHPREIRGM
jgi:hypothetical protein